MFRNRYLKALAAAVFIAGGATLAVVTLTTTTPNDAHAHIPMAMLAPTANGQPASLAPMLKNVLPAVVNIAVSGSVPIRNPLMQDPFFRHFFGAPDGQQPEQREETQAIGSGVIVDAAKGYILTNHHVIADADSIKVTLKDGRTLPAKLIGSDTPTDIAVLQVKADNLTALPMADSGTLQVGDFVVAIGDPFGLGQTVTAGIVSALDRTTDIDGYQNFIQTDASINPGNSGGALVDLQGRLVGINSQILSRSGGNIGIGFAIPTDLARTVMDAIIKHGKIEHGQIGVMIQKLTPELAKALGLKEQTGVIVSKVMPDSPADKAGLKTEDVIVSVNGRPVTDALQLRNAVGLLEVGQKVKLGVVRDSKQRDITVTVGKSADVTAAADGDDLFPALKGASYATLTGVQPNGGPSRGIVVKNVQQGSPADQSGLQSGDVITSVNRQSVTTLDAFRKLANKNQPQLLLRVARGNGALFVLLSK
ncbi:MAG: DegQ family serine endoprotease [Nevskiaceae bacterium]|nr:MAG: DegQ family serine endoprotease [Nevskiaceae bacterium]TBR75101.1 MAG: DegQ family serine endoprotease [Nevskiaceae bacterium]